MKIVQSLIKSTTCK